MAMAIVMMVGSFISILNQNLMTTAVPTFMEVFSVSAGVAQWLTTAFMLANGVVIPVTSYLIRKFPCRTLYCLALALFAAGTVVCAAAPVFEVLLAGRVVQALGAGMLMPLMQTVLFAIFPADKRGTAMGFFGLVIAFAPAMGPTISGWIMDSLPWEALFLLILPLILIDLVAAFFLVDNVTEQTDPDFDPFSVVLSSLGFGGLLYGFGMVSSLGWTDPHILVTVAASLVAIVWFVVRQLRLDTPMLEMRVFAHGPFAVSMLLVVLVWTAFMGSATLLPLYMQNDYGFTPLESGLTLMAGGIVMGVLSPVTGRVFDSHGAKPMVPIGFAAELAGTTLLALSTPESGMAYLACAYAVMMAGNAMISMPLTTNALNSLPTRMIPHGTAMNNTVRQIFGALGTAVFVSLVAGFAAASGLSGTAAEAAGMNAAFAVMAALQALGLVLACALLKKRVVRPDEAAE